VTFLLSAAANGAGASFLTGGTQATAFTDTSGQATSPPFAANATAGKFTATASAAGGSALVTFTLNNHAPTTAIAATTQKVQRATVQRRYPRPLRTRVLDGAGQPIEGVTVTFTLAQ